MGRLQLQTQVTSWFRDDAKEFQGGRCLGILITRTAFRLFRIFYLSVNVTGFCSNLGKKERRLFYGNSHSGI